MTASTSVQPVVRVQNASVWFGTVCAVNNLTFEVRQGERVAILGRTGAGKSTLLNLLIGNIAPTSGELNVAGVDPFAQHRQLQGRIGMAFQSPRLLPWRTAVDNAGVGLEILKRPKSERRQVALQWLDRMSLADAADRYPSQLSGGMRQRVSLARAFAINPELVLLDESFSALDEVTAKDLRADFVDLCRSEAMTALIVTHSIEEAFDLADRVLVFGRPARILAEYDTRAALAERPFIQLREEIHQLMVAAGDPASDQPNEPQNQVAS